MLCCAGPAASPAQRAADVLHLLPHRRQRPAKLRVLHLRGGERGLELRDITLRVARAVWRGARSS